MKPFKFLATTLLAIGPAFCQALQTASPPGSAEILAVSASLGFNAMDRWQPSTQSGNESRWAALSARTQLQLNIPLGRFPVRPFVGGYLSGEPIAWEGGGILGINWKRNARESYGGFWGLLERGQIDITVSPDNVDRWHGSQFGLTARYQSLRFPRLAYVGLASAQFKESYESTEESKGFNTYLGLEFALL